MTLGYHNSWVKLKDKVFLQLIMWQVDKKYKIIFYFVYHVYSFFKLTHNGFEELSKKTLVLYFIVLKKG